MKSGYYGRVERVDLLNVSLSVAALQSTESQIRGNGEVKPSVVHHFQAITPANTVEHELPEATVQARTAEAAFIFKY